MLAQTLGGAFQRADVLGVLMAVTFDPAGQHFGVDSFDRRFTGCVNVSHQQDIGVIERAGKLVHQIGRARVAMRLKQHHDAPVRARRCAPRSTLP